MFAKQQQQIDLGTMPVPICHLSKCIALVPHTSTYLLAKENFNNENENHNCFTHDVHKNDQYGRGKDIHEFLVSLN